VWKLSLGRTYLNETQVEAEPQLPSRKVPDSDADTSFGGKKGKKSPLKKKTAATKTEVSVKVEPTVKVEEMTTTTPIEPTSSGEKKEVWFHESCLVWAPGVCLIPPRLVGLDEAIADSRLQVRFHLVKLELKLV